MNYAKLDIYKKGLLIGALIGLIGVILLTTMQVVAPDSLNMLARIVVIPFFVIMVIPVIIGVFGCSWKSDACIPEVVLGDILVIIVYALLGLGIAWLIKRFRRK